MIETLSYLSHQVLVRVSVASLQKLRWLVSISNALKILLKIFLQRHYADSFSFSGLSLYFICLVALYTWSITAILITLCRNYRIVLPKYMQGQPGETKEDVKARILANRSMITLTPLSLSLGFQKRV